MTEKTLTETLATVDTLVKVCRLLEGTGMNRREFSDRERLATALEWLGLTDAVDHYGLLEDVLRALMDA